MLWREWRTLPTAAWASEGEATGAPLFSVGDTPGRHLRHLMRGAYMRCWPRPSKDAILLIKPERGSRHGNLCWEKGAAGGSGKSQRGGLPSGNGGGPPHNSHTPVVSSVSGSSTPAFKVIVLGCMTRTSGDGSPISIAFCCYFSQAGEKFSWLLVSPSSTHAWVLSKAQIKPPASSPPCTSDP